MPNGGHLGIKMKDIFLHKKIPAKFSTDAAFAMRNLLWDHLESHGISCDVGIGGGYVEVIAMPESQAQIDTVLQLAKRYRFKVSKEWLATKMMKEQL
jgi:hypothetical protein